MLPKGISRIEGEFVRGAVVLIVDESGKVLARGISRYDSADLRRIMRHNSEEIEAVLGFEHGHVAVHRDDMVMM